MIKQRKISAILTLLIVLISLSFSGVKAKDAMTLEVFPPTAYLFVKPGAGISHQITLKNTGKYTLTVTPQVVDFHADGLSGRAILEQTSDFKHISIAGDQEKWGESLTIKPGEQKAIPLVLAIPGDFEQGEYYLSILFRAEQMLFGAGEKANQTLISGMLASNIILLCSSDEEDRSELIIEHFSLPRVVDSLMGIKFSALVKNIGFNAAPIEGQIKVSHWPSTDIKIYKLYPDMVLAKSKRLVRGMSEENLEKLEELEEQKAVMEANDENFDFKKAQFIRQNLISDFYYSKAFLLGAYDFQLKVGDDLLQQRVVALPFSILGALFLLPLFYKVLLVILKGLDKTAKNE